ncbi:hypothetical protein Pfo_031424 [Paulownia fortunei]|nr:hypothetical protein Pfo_031424 [Paulownia fortunei]
MTNWAKVIAMCNTVANAAEVEGVEALSCKDGLALPYYGRTLLSPHCSPPNDWDRSSLFQPTCTIGGKQLQQLQQQTYDQLAASTSKYKQQADCHRCAVEFSIGDTSGDDDSIVDSRVNLFHHRRMMDQFFSPSDDDSIFPHGMESYGPT